jgi:hypothetical protein
MINAPTVGVHDHKTHMPAPGVSSRSLIDSATPVAINSTSTEKMAARLVSVSLVNILCASSISCVCELSASVQLVFPFLAVTLPRESAFAEIPAGPERYLRNPGGTGLLP